MHRGLHFGVALGPGPDRRSPLRHRSHRPLENVHAGIVPGFAGSPRQGHANSRRGGGQRPSEGGREGGRERGRGGGRDAVASEGGREGGRAGERGREGEREREARERGI